MRIFPCWTILVLLSSGVHGFAAPKTQVQLVLSHEQAAPGDRVIAGVELRMPKSWHTYWRNPGDSGQATKLDWTVPSGITPGETLWPVPEKFVDPPFTTY